MSSYLTIYGVPKKDPDGGKEPLPIRLLCYSRSHPIYQIFNEEINPAYCGCAEDGDPMPYTDLTRAAMDRVMGAARQEVIDNNEKLNLWSQRLFHAMRGRNVELDGYGNEMEADTSSEDSVVSPENDMVSLRNKGFEIINEWITMYTEALNDSKSLLDGLSVIESLVMDSTSEYYGDNDWSRTFEKIICNVD